MTYAQNMNGYISTRGRALALTILVTLQLFTLLGAAAAWASGASALDHDLTGAAAAFTTAAAIGSFDTLLFIAATVVFLTWVHRAMANLAPLGSMSTRFSPAMAVWAYIIPFVNFVWGHTVMATIWQESQPPAMTDEGFYAKRSTALVNWWWGLYLACIVIAMSMMFARPFGVEQLHALATKEIIFLVVRAVNALLFILMIRGAQKRQDEQWQDLERRRNVPQPTAEALR
jgi:hypothetical protein